MKKGENMFKVGDIVEITAEADATGMLEFKSGNGYVVQDFRTAKAGVCWEQVYLCGEGNSSEGWYAASHFKLKEEAKVEKKECLFKEGQVVWDLVYGKGEVSDVDFLNFPSYPVCVKFDQLGSVLRSYTAEGVPSEFGIRSLYFSEPKIEAATGPVFEPVLKQGDVVIAVDNDGWSEVVNVKQELEEKVRNDQGTYFYKEAFTFYRVGEKIKFN